ncbi:MULTISPECIES: DUF3168 domain-containing protein [unclassified Methylibium]|uniref:DUF3168 domain-containing protein n=1 Tax=unclassified Methylibium TaxID=2633235 RepID=UPI0003F4402A|nr:MULTISPECIES: DUF3168 domain-containing protein [unclassified Methylibium]EWS53020.1 hypothetical protein X551_04186 [Methylibium sp. T29]EWS58511.1 hypothetical protein Y694_03607 [Methylibium sp. T29-B]
MYPPVFPAVAASTAVKALLGSNPVRFYQFGLAPQNVQKPYAVWQRVFGAPENYLGSTPDIDTFSIQIDVYASPDSSGANTARNVAQAIRDAIEPHCHITSWLGESVDPDTMSHRFSFQSDWITAR